MGKVISLEEKQSDIVEQLRERAERMSRWAQLCGKFFTCEANYKKAQILMQLAKDRGDTADIAFYEGAADKLLAEMQHTTDELMELNQ